MFNFLQDVGNYESRCVGRFDNEDSTIMVSTAAVSDGNQPYETAVRHPDYNDGHMVIVEAYDTRDDAKQAHDWWVEVITSEPLPEKLTDCGNAIISQMIEATGGKMKFPRKTQEK